MKNIFSLKNKIIVITGGAGMLGLQHAIAVVEADGIPVLLDINEDSLNKVVLTLQKKYNIKSFGYKVDLTNEKDIIENSKLLIEKHSKIDGLINNAANNPQVRDKVNQKFSRLENFLISNWEQDIKVGLTGAFLCTKHYGTAIVKSLNKGTGVIINISSDLGLIGPDQRLYEEKGLSNEEQPKKPVSYSVVKSGLIGLTKYTSTYWPEKLRCNALCPGGVKLEQNDKFINDLTFRIPMNRMAKPGEYKGAIVFLLSDASSYMNGAILSIDGGRTAW